MCKNIKLMIASSEHDSDMLYISGLFVPDPFIAIEIDGEWHGLFSTLEVDRARQDSQFKHVHLDSEWRDKAEKKGLERSIVSTAISFLADNNKQNITVPPQFSALHMEQLRAAGLQVNVHPTSFFPQRQQKTKKEIEQLCIVEKLTAQAMHHAYEVLAAARISDNMIYVGTEAMSAQYLRGEIESFLIRQGAVPSHTIVACGTQSADPHQEGNGLLYAHQPIIIDIFPRLTSTGYWGDMTRTFVKGKASQDLKKMYQTVAEGQDIGLNMLGHGIEPKDIHQAIVSHFEKCGFYTGERDGKQVGFIHSTGHGVGLDIHELPSVSMRGSTLKSGHIVTVEPGLYYPDIGGVRLEDMALVCDSGHKNLTNYRRELEIV
ncbi:MAG: Xaa-Pro peptidase family protein [Mariprofundaceae bacterium]|nr:Xaa-Pro peptidase family protein [Mariprofundaceae bacterium]